MVCAVSIIAVAAIVADITMSSDTDRDPALGHADDFADETTSSDKDVVGEPEERSVIGVPLMEGEERIHEAHPSWWLFVPEMTMTGVLYGVIGAFLLWVYTPFINIGFPSEIETVFNTMYSNFADALGQMGYAISPEFSVPWWIWVFGIVVASYPIMKAYLKARFTHYVLTTDRVMSIETFPGKTKDWAEIRNIRSFTSDADFVEQRLGVGSVKFQPANEDPIVFSHIDDYEYWESSVKQIRQEKSDDDPVDIPQPE